MNLYGGFPFPTDNVICNGSTNFLTTELFFEPEVPIASMKRVPPTWNEIEQLMDFPYSVVSGNSCQDAGGPVPGTDPDSGYPTYCTNGSFIRRPNLFTGSGAPTTNLPFMLVHPLNYNPPSGAEMRILNPNYAGGNFQVSGGGPNLLNIRGLCYTTGLVCNPPNRSIAVSSGASRLNRDEPEIDYLVGVGRQLVFCQTNPEPVPIGAPMDPFAVDSETLTVCGAEWGEPGAMPHLIPAFEDNLAIPMNPTSNASYYSTPAVPAPNAILSVRFQLPPGTLGASIPTGANIPLFPPSAANLFANFRLVDPGNRGTIQARNVVTGAQGLRKPSLRVPDAGGTGLNPNYLANTDPDDTTPSNENDFIGLLPSAGTNTTNYAARKNAARLEAMRMGKALFWDQQVGSDAVQACGSCHAHAGADNRTKNQMNPNDIGIPSDLNFEIGVGETTGGTPFGANHDLVASDFPIHKLFDPEIAGDPLCTDPLVADVSGIQFPDGEAPDHPRGTLTVCDAANIANRRADGSDQNDVASSMGVHFGRFYDVPPIGTGPGQSFGPPSATGGVRSLLPDLRSPVAADNIDPIPGFAGTDGSGNQFRRVEPRNTPTIFLADFNFDNFWDGRARHDDNGGSVFGAADPQAHVFVDSAGSLTATRQMIKFSSLASLAKGPALSQFEMSFNGRNWAKIGKKLLQPGVTPLANQLVSPTDGVLGPYSNQNTGSAYATCAALPAAEQSGSWAPTGMVGKPGLCISYAGLIRHAFYPALHQNTSKHLNGCYTDGRADIHPNQCGTTDPVTGRVYPAADIRVLDPDGSVQSHNNDPFDQYVLYTPTGGPGETEGPADPTDRNQFTQMEANFSLFFGQALHLWATILVPDDTPWDKWMDANPDAGFTIGESGEPLLVLDLRNCTTSVHRQCFAEVGNFKRDSNLTATTNSPTNPALPPFTSDSTGRHYIGGACVAQTVVAGARQCTQRVSAPGTRTPGSNMPDPLLGMDIFFGSNVSLKNPEFRSARCGECHAPPTLTDNTFPFTVKATLVDLAAEFERGNPITEPLMEPLGYQRIISGFLLESEINGPGQDAIERRMPNFSIVPAPVSPNPNCVVDTCSGYVFPDGITNALQHACVAPNVPHGNACIHQELKDGPVGGSFPDPVPFTSFGGAFFDNGVYNLGVTQCEAGQTAVVVRPSGSAGGGRCDDNGRGNTDAFGWPLSLAALLLKNLGGTAQQPGELIADYDPSFDPACAPYCWSGGLWETNGHDQQMNPGFGDETEDPQLPGYLAPFTSNIMVGDAHPQLDEAGGSPGGMVNTLTDVATIEGFPEIPFDPRGHMSEVVNSGLAPGDGTLGGGVGMPMDYRGGAQQGTWPMVNRVGRFGSIKAAQLREIELTGPYFHNGGKLTLRQVVDFYVRGGDYPVVNAEHRDFNIMNLNAELQSDLSEDEKVALVDFLLELTDDRVSREKAPFDHPEAILPLDGTAPENGDFSGLAFRDAVLASCVAATNFGPGQQACMGGMFLRVPETGTGGNSAPLPNFMGISSGPRLVGAQANCSMPGTNPAPGVSHYCH